MTKRLNGRSWCCGGVLMALLGGCAVGTPTAAPTDAERSRVLPHGNAVQAEADRAGAQQMGWNQQQMGAYAGQQDCPAPQQQSGTDRAYGADDRQRWGDQPAGTLGSNQQMGDRDKDKMEKDKKDKRDKKDKKKDKEERPGHEGGQQQAYGQPQDVAQQQAQPLGAAQPATGGQQVGTGY